MAQGSALTKEERRLRDNKKQRERRLRQRDKLLARRRELYIQNNGAEYARKKRAEYGKAYQAAANKRYRDKHPEKVKAIYRAYRKRIWDALAAIKMESGCVDCGYNKHPAALDFDHIKGDKIAEVSVLGGYDEALAEAAKCVVRCSNCHRIATYERKKVK